MKKILIMNGSHSEIALIQAAKELGYYVITSGNDPELSGHQYADEYVCGDYSDLDAMLKIASEKNIDAVCSCANDFGTISASYIAEKLNLPGHDPYGVTQMLHRKDLFKAFAREHNLLTPPADQYDNLETALRAKDCYQYPVIVKPVDLTGGKGVTKIESANEYRCAAEHALATSRKGKIVVERYIQGSQHGFCTFLVNKKVVAVCSNNEYSFINPYRVEIDTFPAVGIERCRSVLIEQVERIANILSLKDGIFHLQYIEDQEGPHIIEAMRRILGNMYAVPANAHMGFDWNEWEIKARSGLPCDNFPRNAKPAGFYAYKTIYAKENGRIESINIPEKYRRVLMREHMLHFKGDFITQPDSDPIGFLFMKFLSQEEMYRELIENYEIDEFVKIEKM